MLTTKRVGRRFHAHGTVQMSALDGLPLAAFWQRLVGYIVDLFIAVLVWFPLEFAWRHFLLGEQEVHLAWDFHEVGNILVMLLYWGLGNSPTARHQANGSFGPE